jgi:hypothetical protein
MRRILLVPALLGPLLQGCSLGPIMPGGCDQLAMSESRKAACESSLVPIWAKSPAAGTPAPENQCRRTIGGVECYAPH